MASTYAQFVAFVTPLGGHVIWSTTYPSAASDGTYVAGDIIYNMQPSSTGVVNPIGWACTVGGSPGTWAPFGGVTEGVQLVTGSGAIPAGAAATYVITDAGVAALTLAAPALASNGLVIEVTSSTAYAHTITATGVLNTGTASVNEITFAAHAGATVRLMAYNAFWQVLSYNNVTFS